VLVLGVWPRPLSGWVASEAVQFDAGVDPLVDEVA
jgi:hypothetical protein